MVITLTAPESGRKYQIRSNENGLGYQIFKERSEELGTKARNGKIIKSQWVFTGKYPWDIRSALETSVSLMLADSEESIDASSIKDITKHINSQVTKFINSAMLEEPEAEGL